MCGMLQCKSCHRRILTEIQWDGNTNTGISGVDGNVTENAWTESFY